MKHITPYLLAPPVAAAWAWAVVLAVETGRDGLVLMTAGPLILIWIVIAAIALVWLWRLLFQRPPTGARCEECGAVATISHSRRSHVCPRCDFYRRAGA